MAAPLANSIRTAEAADLRSLAKIYRDAVDHLGSEHYSPEQVAAWSSFADSTEEFRDWILGATTFIVENPDGDRLGFGGLQSRGRIASLYVAPEAMRSGVGSQLLERLLEEARSKEMRSVTTEASAFSRPLFQKYGFRMVRVEQTLFKGVEFTRYLMRARIQESVSK